MSDSKHHRGPSIASQTYAVPDDSQELYDSSDSDSSYAGSGEQLQENEFSPVNYLQAAFARVFDPQNLDRAVVTQAQTSGMINSKSQELAELQQQASQRVQEIKTMFNNGIKVARQVQRDLDYVQKKTVALNKKARVRHPIEFQQAQEDIKDRN